MDNLILEKKLLYYHHLANLPVESLAGEFFQLQLENNIEGIVTECKEHIMKMGNLNPRQTSKPLWKKRTKLYIEDKNKAELLEDIKKYKKLNYEEMSKETSKRKKYFFENNLEEVRFMFKIKSEILPTIRKNFPRKYKNQTLNCPSCRSNDNDLSSPQEDTQKHLMFNCPTFASLRMDKDLVNNDTHLLQFLRDVIQYRIENNED